MGSEQGKDDCGMCRVWGAYPPSLCQGEGRWGLRSLLKTAALPGCQWQPPLSLALGHTGFLWWCLLVQSYRTLHDHPLQV